MVKSVKSVVLLLTLVFCLGSAIHAGDVSGAEALIARMVFFREIEGVMSLYTVEDSGTIRQLATDLFLPLIGGAFLSWSNDCEMIAFNAATTEEGLYRRGIGLEVFTYSFQTDNLQQITDNEYMDSNVFWLPGHDRTITYAGYDIEGSPLPETTVYNLKTNEQSSFPGELRNGLFAPDGTIFYGTGFSENRYSIYAFSLTGEQETRYPVMSLNLLIPRRISNDGTRLLYTVADRTYSNLSSLHSVNVNGTNVQQLTENREIRDAAWSPDATQVVYTDANNVWIMQSDGSQKTNLTSRLRIGDNYFSYADWLLGWDEDTDTILVQAVTSESPREVFIDIFALQADGSSLTRLTERQEDDLLSPRYWNACLKSESN
jgi:Tol biopolymer transport system component